MCMLILKQSKPAAAESLSFNIRKDVLSSFETIWATKPFKGTISTIDNRVPWQRSSEQLQNIKIKSEGIANSKTLEQVTQPFPPVFNKSVQKQCQKFLCVELLYQLT